MESVAPAPAMIASRRSLLEVNAWLIGHPWAVGYSGCSARDEPGWSAMLRRCRSERQYSRPKETIGVGYEVRRGLCAASEMEWVVIHEIL